MSEYKELRQQVMDVMWEPTRMGDIIQNLEGMADAVIAFMKGSEAEREEEMQRMAQSLAAIRAGHTLTFPASFGKTREYDLSPAMVESALRDKMIELGWTPPVSALDEWLADWSKTEDALPPDGSSVLTFGAKRLGFAVMQYSERDGWEVESPSEWHSTYAPTHWKPLPAAPK